MPDINKRLPFRMTCSLLFASERSSGDATRQTRDCPGGSWAEEEGQQGQTSDRGRAEREGNVTAQHQPTTARDQNIILIIQLPGTGQPPPSNISWCLDRADHRHQSPAQHSVKEL